jgi:hypothetical protein
MKFLAVRDRISIAAAFVDADGLEVFHGRRFDLPDLQQERHGELSSGLLKPDRSPAVAGDRPSVPPTIVNANSDTRGAEKKISCIDRNPDLQRDLKNGPEDGIARKMCGRFS